MIRRKTSLVAVALLAAIALIPSTASAAEPTPAPAWKVTVVPMPTNFAPGSSGDLNGGPMYYIRATNVGGAPTSGPVTIADTLPDELTPIAKESLLPCAIDDQTVTCVESAPVHPGMALSAKVGVAVDPLVDPSFVTNQVTVSGGGALPAQASYTTTIGSALAPFGFLEGGAGFGLALTEVDGSPTTQAGAHPDQLTVELGFNTRPANHTVGTGKIMPSGGGVHDAVTYLPRGLVVDPNASPVRCTEAQLESNSCPDESVIGVASTFTGVAGSPVFDQQPLYNMVPPPGQAAALAFNPIGQGIYVHVFGGVRAGDYALAAASYDALAYFGSPFYGIQLQLWGDPSSPIHNAARGDCIRSSVNDSCPVEAQDTPLLTAPTSCSGLTPFEASVDSWGDPGKFHSQSVDLSDLEGNPVGVSGCNALEFAPTLKARPTTNLADSPTGLDVDLQIPQPSDHEGLAEAHLRKAVVTLPEGLVINPSSANGLAACSPEQIGIDADTGVADGDRPNCPNASKIGSVEVDTPLLDQPLPGAVYVATPYDNPFDSLLAIYIALDDPETGVVVKLAGHVVADPQTGRLRTTFDENPQLPFGSFKLKFFGGAGAALRTPVSCATHTTTSDMTPWSAPEGKVAHPTDPFAIIATPGGGDCPTSEAAAPHAPAFSAGTIAPVAGAYSPFVLKLSRPDGSQPLAGIDATMPPGLSGRLAGIPYCPEAALAAAASKSGEAEKASPSCPAASELGVADVAAGAGPTPYHAQGRAYLTGPYKGAPLSLTIVTPASAGPYDLGTVVVRTALYLNSQTAQIHAVSDPIPHILQGIPLDVRSITLRMERPNFTLNPTSCDPMAIAGAATSVLGQSAALSSPFQVGGCSSLPFKPKLTLRLKGGTKRADHPKLIATLKAKPGEAGIAKARVTLPRSAFLDQAHIRTICTRVQFAADACPPGSIYGRATATTPLLDYPVSGPVYLRSSDNKLPDLVIALKGPDHQPIEVELAGRTDSVKGALRNSFEAVPDAPVTRFRLELFGGKRGLVVNSRNLCARAYRATVELEGQNGKVHEAGPALGTDCKKGRKGKRLR